MRVTKAMMGCLFQELYQRKCEEFREHKRVLFNGLKLNADIFLTPLLRISTSFQSRHLLVVQHIELQTLLGLVLAAYGSTWYVFQQLFFIVIIVTFIILWFVTQYLYHQV